MTERGRLGVTTSKRSAILYPRDYELWSCYDMQQDWKEALSHIGMVQEDKIADFRATKIFVIRLLAY